jgi:hypothetical protein
MARDSVLSFRELVRKAGDVEERLEFRIGKGHCGGHGDVLDDS